MLNLNPEIVDQDRIRKLKRKRLLKIAAIPTLALFVVGLFFLRTGIFNVMFANSYNNGLYDSAKTFADIQSFANIISPYIMYFDRGDALFQQAEYKKAEDEFRASLRENPPETELCKIYVNLSLSVERQADILMNDKKLDEALVLYNSAEAILYENNCAEKRDDQRGKDPRADSSKDRIINKRRQVISMINAMEEGGGEGEGGGTQGQGVSEDDLRRIQNMQNPQEALNNIRNRLNGGGYGGSYSGNIEIYW